MILYAVRHGETDYNRENRLQGSLDISLNAEGRKQAEKLRKQLENTPLDIVISSPLKRALETAQIIAPHSHIITDCRLRERYLGEFEGQHFSAYDVQKYNDYFLNSHDCNVEGIAEVLDRLADFLEDIRKQYSDKTVLIVGHGGNLKLIPFCLDGIPADGKLYRKVLANGEIVSYQL